MAQLVVNIVVLASIYALISCGYVLIYRVSRVLNLAHGELMMLGAYLLFCVATSVSSVPAIAIGAALILSFVVGILVYLVLLRWMTGNSVLAAVLLTLALGITLRGMMILIWTGQSRNPAQVLRIVNPAIEIVPGGRLSLLSLILVATTLAVYGGLFTFLRFSRWGVRMRAAGQNPLLAAQRGINLHGIYALTWGLSTLTAAAAGILIALDTGLEPTLTIIGLKAFPAALVGGLDSLAGALVGSLIVAAAEVVLIQEIDPLLSEVVPFIILLAMLIIRPWGLFGTREELDRV
ncbi:MAG TPA: branched-chain amino acid ABC transporter permease [Stellaceae bacterium]